MLASILIANRGEIVARIAAHGAAPRRRRRSRSPPTPTATRPSPPRCDRVVAIGGERAADSYLRIDAIVAAARSSGVAGGPSRLRLPERERATSPTRSRPPGWSWIGPPPAAMRAMADKAAARRRMHAAGVPVLPGYDGAAQDAATLQRRSDAARLSADGQGGRRRRRARHATGRERGRARRGARARPRPKRTAAFGDAPAPARARRRRARATSRSRSSPTRTATSIHLGERDCSLQRRHQKLVEEAPSPAVDAGAAPADGRGRGRGRARGRLSRRRHGRVPARRRAATFWFIEMNTRLQVEHAVTEALLGVDLVEWQLRVAAGEAAAAGRRTRRSRATKPAATRSRRACAPRIRRRATCRSRGASSRWQRRARRAHRPRARRRRRSVPPFYDSMLGARDRPRADAAPTPSRGSPTRSTRPSASA